MIGMIAVVVGAYGQTALADAKCEVDGQDILDAATKNGFQVHIKKSQPDSGSCIQTNNKFTAIAGESDPLVCTVEALAGRTLSSSWRIDKFRVSGGSFSRVQTGNEEGAGIAFSIKAKPGEDETRSIATVTLIGPDCADWIEAFENADDIESSAQPRDDERTEREQPPSDEGSTREGGEQSSSHADAP